MYEMSISAWQCKKRIKKLALYLSSYVYNHRHNAVGQKSLRIHSYFKKINHHKTRVRRIKKNPALTEWKEYRARSIGLFFLTFFSFLGYFILSLRDKNNDMPAFETPWLPQFFSGLIKQNDASIQF